MSLTASDYTKLAEDELTAGNGDLDREAAGRLYRLLLACDRERQEAERDAADAWEVSAKWQKDAEKAEALAQRYRDALFQLHFAAEVAERAPNGVGVQQQLHDALAIARAALAAGDKT